MAAAHDAARAALKKALTIEDGMNKLAEMSRELSMLVQGSRNLEKLPRAERIRIENLASEARNACNGAASAVEVASHKLAGLAFGLGEVDLGDVLDDTDQGDLFGDGVPPPDEPDGDGDTPAEAPDGTPPNTTEGVEGDPNAERIPTSRHLMPSIDAAELAKRAEWREAPLENVRVPDLRIKARDIGVPHYWDMRKPDLVAAVQQWEAGHDFIPAENAQELESAALIYRDGVSAQLGGKATTTNPYPESTDAWDDWANGWGDALAGTATLEADGTLVTSNERYAPTPAAPEGEAVDTDDVGDLDADDLDYEDETPDAEFAALNDHDLDDDLPEDDEAFGDDANADLGGFDDDEDEA